MNMITEDRIQRIEGRVTAVEQAQNDNTQSLRFIVATVAQTKAVQDDHGHILEDHSRLLGEQGRLLGEQGRLLGEQGRVLGEHGRLLGELRGDVNGLRNEIHTLRKELPVIVADVMREVLREQR
jgi:DNA-binding FrmR family transcriptional regulator